MTWIKCHHFNSVYIYMKEKCISKTHKKNSVSKCNYTNTFDFICNFQFLVKKMGIFSGEALTFH